MIERELIGKRVLDCAMAVHSGLGPGLLESVYEACMFYELTRRGLEVQRQVVMPVRYKDVEIENGFRLDLLVERKVVLELRLLKASMMFTWHKC